MSLESRKDNLVKSWQFVKNANQIYKESLPRFVLLKAIREKLGVSESTAEEYIWTLKHTGIEFNHKKLSLLIKSGLGLDETYEAIEQ